MLARELFAPVFSHFGRLGIRKVDEDSLQPITHGAYRVNSSHEFMIGQSLVHKAITMPRVGLFSIRNTFGILPAHSFENPRGGTFPLFTAVSTGTAFLELIEIILFRSEKVPLLSPVQAAKDLSPEEEISL